MPIQDLETMEVEPALSDREMDELDGFLMSDATSNEVMLLDCVFHANWTVSPRQSGQSARSDAGVVFYS